MGKAKPLILAIGIPVVIIVLLLIVHEMVEARIFRELARQPGMQLTIGSRSGNLFSGYTLRRVSIRQGGQGNIPPSTMGLPELSIRWKLAPFSLTELSWDSGTFTAENNSGTNEEIEIGSATFTPGDSGWLESDGPVRIGPERWNGSLDLKIKQTGREVDGLILIERFPSRLIRSFGEIPAGVTLPTDVRVEASITGPLSNIRTDTSIMDPLTRQRYRF